jgi:hypothetical protein
MENKMNKKILVFIAACALLLASCGPLADLGIGTGAVEQDLQLQEIEPEPTEAILSETSYVRYEFDDDINKDWGMRVISGLEDQLIWDQTNNRLRLQTLPPNDLNIAFFNKKLNYKDVIVQADVENIGQLDNAFSLMCRVSENGWYEFRISSSGYYELLRFDQYKKDEGKNAYTNFLEKRVGSTKIMGALAKNTFSLSCVDNVISAFVNGEQLYWKKRPLAIEDNMYGEGSVGFGILSYGDSLDMIYTAVETIKP